MNNKFNKYLVNEFHHDLGSQSINQWLYSFPNGYGANVICNRHNGKIVTKGDEECPFELAVLTMIDDEAYDLCFDTEITDGVIGWLDEANVEKYLEQIFNL